MATAYNEKTPLLRDSPKLKQNVLESSAEKPHRPTGARRQLSTIDCAAHPEACPLVTGIGLLALDGGWGWVVVLATLLCNFLQASMSRTFGVVYPTIQARFSSTAAATTAIQSISSSLRLFGAPISSSLCDWYGARGLVIVGGCLQALGYGISAVAPNIYFLYFSLGVMTGIGGALTYTPTHILVNTYFNKKKGQALGIATSGIGIGTFLMAPLQTFLLIEYSYVGYCLMMCGILLNYIVGGALLRPIESNHADHKVQQAKVHRQRSLTNRRLHASTCSNPSVFYEHEFAFSPDWEKNITGTDSDDEDQSLKNLADSFPSIRIPKKTLPSNRVARSMPTNYMSTGNFSSNMADGSTSSNMAAGSTSSDMAAGSTSHLETSGHENDTLYGVVVSILSPDGLPVPDTDTTNTLDKTSKVDTNQDISNVDTSETHQYVEETEEAPAEYMTNDSAVDGYGNKPSTSTDTHGLVVDKARHKHSRSVTIYDPVTEISASSRSGDSESHEHQTFLESVTSSMRRRHESVTASVQEVSNGLAFFRKKFKLFTILAFVLYSGQNLVLQFCTAAPLTFLPQLGVENGSTETAASLLISVSGVFDIVGRYLFGFLFDVRAVVPRRRLLHGILGLLLGVATFVLGLTTDYPTMFAASAFHGMMAGGYHAQKTSVVAEFVPITLMSDAVGFSFFFEGFGSLVAAPLFGLAVDRFDTYRYGYFGCGVIFIFFTVLVLLEYCLSGVGILKRRKA